jgi:hypothetical protein
MEVVQMEQTDDGWLVQMNWNRGLSDGLDAARGKGLELRFGQRDAQMG